MRSGLAKLLREPLLHFAVSGAVLFAGYAWLNQEQMTTTALEPVRIGAGEIAWLKETWTSQWLREPSRDELKGLVADLVKEELLAREAAEMRLDEHDTIVRRRLAQKLQFLVEDTARLEEPTEQELRQFYAANLSRFQSEPRVSFAQLFFNPEQRQDARSDAVAALATLKSGHNGSSSTIGDRLLIDANLRNADEQTVSSTFGPEFTRAVFALSPGAWSGPITSGYGVHLVSIDDLTPAKQIPFESVRDQVLVEWRRKQESDANRDYLARLREKYGVVLDDAATALLGTEVAGGL